MNDVGFNIIDPDVTGIAFPIGLKMTNTWSFMIRLKFGMAVEYSFLYKKICKMSRKFLSTI